MISTETPLKRWVKLLLSSLKGTELYSYLHAYSMARDIISGKFIEPEIYLLPYFVQEGDSVIDGGANYGLYSYHLSRIVGNSGFVIAFEPIQYTFSTLSKVCKLLKLKNVQLFEIALGDYSGQVTLEVPLQKGGHLMGGQAFLSTRNDRHGDVDSQVRWTNTNKYSCKINKLDDIIDYKVADSIAFIKLDIEGAEFFALNGAKNILINHHPTLLVEVNPWFLEGFDVSMHSFLQLFKSHGYIMYHFDPLLKKLKPMTCREEVVESNYLFIHPSRLNHLQHLISCDD